MYYDKYDFYKVTVVNQIYQHRHSALWDFIFERDIS